MPASTGAAPMRSIGVFAGAAISTYLLTQLPPSHATGPMPPPSQLLAMTRQRQGLPGDARRLQARPARPGDQRADRVLDLAGGGAPGLPEPARGRVRHGAGGRRHACGCRSASATCHEASGIARRRTATAAPFDADADGTVFGSGAGVVVLKRLTDALADGDPIRAVILGSAVNNDGGRKVGFTAPSVDGQAAVIGRGAGGRRGRRRTTSATSRRTAPARRSATRSRWRR